MNEVRGAADELRFLVEPLDHSADPDAGSLPALGVPEGVSRLRARREGAELLPGVGSAGEIHFERVAAGRGDALLMRLPRGAAGVRVNGRPAGLLHVLEVGDQVQTGDVLLHLTRYLRPRAAAPPPDVVGNKCPVCLVPVGPDSNVIVHPPCASPLHLDPEDVPEEMRLQCARMGDCPACGLPVQLEEGYAFLPEL